MRISHDSPWTALPNVPATAASKGKGVNSRSPPTHTTGQAVPTRRRSELRSRRDPEGSRISQERVDLVVAFVGEVGAPDFYRPLAVRAPQAEPRIQQPVGSLELPRIEIRACVIRRVVLLVDVGMKFQR